MIRKLMAGTALVALMSAGAGGVALAADTGANPAVQQQAASSNDSTATSSEKKLVPDQPTLATAFIGRSVYSSADPNSDNIGSVNDLIIGDDGEISAAVVGVGGFLGIGEKNVAVPFDQLKVVEQDGEIRLVYSATKDQLKNAPAFDRTAYDPAARNPNKVAAGGMQPGAPGADTMGAAPMTGAAPDTLGAAPTPGPAPDTMAANPEAAPGAAVTPKPATNDNAAAAAMSAQDFVNTAAIANMFEIQTSQAALDKAENGDVKSFAQRMIDDHTKAGDQMKAAVQNANADVKVPDALDQEHKDKLDQLQQASGADFDRQYVSIQLDAHKQAVDLFQNYADSGDNDALKSFAQNTLPILQDHLQMIQKIASSQMASTSGQDQPQDQVAAANGTTPAAGDNFRTFNPDQVRASTLMGQSVYDQEGKSIGKISDLVLEPDGNTRAALIDVGGFLGIGAKTVALPFSDITVATNVDTSANGTAANNMGGAPAGNATEDVHLTVAMSQDQLKQLPEYQPPAQQAANAGDQTGAAMSGDQTAMNAAPPVNAPEGTATEPAAPATTGSVSTADSQKVGVQDLAASDLMGATVHGTNDETIGDVGDIVFNKDGTIDAVVVDVGGFLGMGEKPVALSFDSLQTRLDDSGNLIVAVAASKDELQNAPTYDESAK